MDRRQFLGVATGSIASAGAVGWIGYLVSRGPELATAYGRAFALGKPLLTLVIPEDDDERWPRGRLFGELLNHGSTDAYLDLALCEIVCATVATVREAFSDVAVEGEPLMLLLETDGSLPRARRIHAQVNYDVPRSTWIGDSSNDDEIDRFLRNRIDIVAAALREQVAPGRERLAERARLAEARLPAAETGVLRAALGARTLPEARALDRAAAVVRLAAEDPEDARILQALADAAAARVQGPPPPGAKWGRSDGCGTTIEGEPDDRNWACGMGHVPEISERFLFFFTKRYRWLFNR